MNVDIKPKILLVDDEASIISTVKTFLELSGFDVGTASNGIDALEKVRVFKPNLIVLDVLMPQLDGRETVRRLRQGNDWTPVILLTQVSGTAQRIMAIEEGADDYLNKPFDPHELVVRIKAVLRRTEAGKQPLQSSRRLKSNNLILDRSARRVFLDDQELALTPKSVSILEYFMTHPDELVTREKLLDTVWGWESAVGERVVDTRIAELRKVLSDVSSDPEFIETVPGAGYRYIATVKVGGMTRLRRYPYLLPLILGIFGIVLLIRILLVDSYILLPENTDVILLLVTLSIGMVFAINVLVRVSISYLRNLTMQRVRNETLAEHRRFLQRLDHELENPLTALRAGLKTLAITNLSEQQQTLVTTMETEVLRLSRLVADLRKITELETQEPFLHPTNIELSLKPILENEVSRFEAGKRQFQFSMSFSRIIWLVDEDLLTLAVHNLLDNAYKYTEPGDTVSVRIDGHYELSIYIHDTGIGIAQDALLQVWEELYRAEQVAHIPGSGIGLALVQAIVERHHGTIEIESELNVGTIIHIQLPFITQA